MNEKMYRHVLWVLIAAGCASSSDPGDGRFVDEFGAEICPVSSGYEGDDYALCDPGADRAIMLHYGPANYDPATMEQFVVPAGGEIEDCVYMRTPNDREVWINAYRGRMRPYSHHLIVTTLPEGTEFPAGVAPGQPVDCGLGRLLDSRWLVGSQDPQIDVTLDGSDGADPTTPGDPEYGLAQRIPPNSIVQLNLHYINTTDRPILREAWVRLDLVDPAQVQQRGDMITFFQGSINVPPRSTGVTTAVGRCRADTDRYVALMTGHFHEHGTRFSIWHSRADGSRSLVYETYNWDSPGNAFYTDRVLNPSVDNIVGDWGATSGYLFVRQGEYLEFQCEYDNPSNETVTLGELGRDQMCNVFGLYFPTEGAEWKCGCLGSICSNDFF